MISDGCHRNRKVANTQTESRLAIAGAWGQVERTVPAPWEGISLGMTKTSQTQMPVVLSNTVDVLNVTAFT